MNWLAFLAAAWICFGLELGLREVLRYGDSGIAPSFVVPLLVWVGLGAQPRHALWAGLLLGVLADLTAPARLVPVGSVVLVGPHALGSLLAVLFVVNVRGLVIRGNPLTLAVLSVVAAALVQIVFSAIIGARTVLGAAPIAWGGAGEFAGRMLSALYTGGLAFVLAFVFARVEPLFGFPHDRPRR